MTHDPSREAFEKWFMAQDGKQRPWTGAHLRDTLIQWDAWQAGMGYAQLETDFKHMTQRGREAWKGVQSATEWVDEMRGSDHQQS